MAPNTGYMYRERLCPEAEGQPLVDYLALRYSHTPREAWQLRCDRGLVILDGEPADGRRAGRGGQMLVWRRPPWQEPEAPTWTRILYEDSEVLAVDKPAGLPTLPGANFLTSTLLYQVRERVPGASPIHRLGRWTSGIVLFARSTQASNDLCRQWAERRIGKRYRALASGDPSWNRHTVNVPIGAVPHPRLGSVHAASPAGKAAASDITILERRSNAFLCDVEIATGRPHQIRIHLAAAGHPLVGDPLYGPGGVPMAGSDALPGDPGYQLHAAELRFRHPRTDRLVTITSSPPKILRTIAEKKLASPR